VPEEWGAFRVVADRVEFWAGRRNRMHDRLAFSRTGDGDLADPASWQVQRLQP
jgi:pyridoxamine 5'-phosphate oxidase